MDLNVLQQRAKAFDYLFDSVVVTDLQGVIIDWNKGSEQLYGYSKKEALGQSVSMLHVPEDRDHITEQVISAVQAQGRWTGEVRMLHKSGRIGWIESMCVPLFDDKQVMIGALGINRDISERKREQERLAQLAHYDCLTKIPNRYMFLDRLQHLIAQSKRNQASFALLYVDIDDFKMINDTYGHGFGDHVLIEMASRMQNLLRDSDTVARIGGDEFVVLLENIQDPSDALAMAQSLTLALDAECMINGISLNVNSSIGLAIYPVDGDSSDALLAKADAAMYHMKHEHKE